MTIGLPPEEPVVVAISAPFTYNCKSENFLSPQFKRKARTGKPKAAWPDAGAKEPMMAGGYSDSFGKCSMRILADREWYVGAFDKFEQYFPVKLEKMKLRPTQVKDITAVVQTRSERDGTAR